MVSVRVDYTGGRGPTRPYYYLYRNSRRHSFPSSRSPRPYFGLAFLPYSLFLYDTIYTPLMLQRTISLSTGFSLHT
jgi:hypothetical protein